MEGIFGVESPVEMTLRKPPAVAVGAVSEGPPLRPRSEFKGKTTGFDPVSVSLLGVRPA